MPVPGPRSRPRTRGPVPRPTTSGTGPVLLLTDDDELAAAVVRLAAAAGCVLRRTGAPSEEPALVLADATTDPAELDALRRPGLAVVVVGNAPVRPAWWRSAAGLDADHAVLLPEAEDRLLELLTDAATGPGGSGTLLAVVGGAGGAGASVLAAGLARALADTLGGCLLVDADPRSGGLDLLLGADALPGLRWGDLAGVDGRISPDVLRASVRLGAGLQVLATDRRGGRAPAPDQLWAVVEASRRAFAATVLDLPRAGLEGLGPVLGACAEVLVVVPGTTRAAAAACVVVDELRAMTTAPVRLVVRDVGTGTDAEDVADAAGAPLAGVVRPDRDLDVGLERGEGVPGGRRSGLRSFALACARDWVQTS